ncbi:MAG: hypothetical protein HZB55_23965 [Deltaproteobacteria bacterium]|nr:hypothetical protein [Deltaproteobacteria bacterium]
MNEPTTPTATALERLAPLLPTGSPTSKDLCPPEALRRLDDHWSRLEGLGFLLEIRPGALRVRHRTVSFESVLHFGGQDDLGERRQLFASLKAAFGGLRDRFPWLWQPSPAVTTPYESLKAVADVCETVRSRRSRSS